MADKDYRIRIDTTGNPAGAREVEEALDDATDSAKELEQATESIGTTNSGDTTSFTAAFREAEGQARALEDAVEDVNTATKDFSNAPPLPFQPAEIKPVAKSMAELTAEVQRLQRELSEVPVGGQRFVELAGQVKRAQTELVQAEQQVRKLGGTMGRGGNAGMAVLEFSRAFEDAQYGVRGVLNNLPGLIAMLGGGAGLAGVISLAAVAGTQLWEIFADSEGAKEGVDAIAEAADKLEKRLKALRDRRQEIAKIPTIDRTAGITEATAALRLQTEGFRQNIQAVKDRISAEEQLDAILNQGALAGVDRDEGSGKINADEAARRRADIERSAKQRQVARAAELSKLDETVAAETREAARRELMLAQFKKDAAEEQLRLAQEESDKLSETLKSRADLNALRQAVERADAEVAALGVPESERNAAGRQRRAEDADSFIAGPLREMFRQSVERLDALFAAQADLARVESGGVPKGLEGLAKDGEAAAEQVAKFRQSLEAADKAVNDAAASFKLAEQSSQAAQSRQENQSQARSDQDAAGQLNTLESQLEQAGERSAERLGQTLESILSVIGDAANQPRVQGQVARVQALIKDGVQATEEGEVITLLNQLVGAIRTSDTRRAGLIQQVLQAVTDGANADRDLQAQIRDLRTTVNGLRSNQGNPNP